MHGSRQVPDYQTLPTLTQVLIGNFLLLLYFGCSANHSQPPENVHLSVIFTPT